MKATSTKKKPPAKKEIKENSLAEEKKYLNRFHNLLLQTPVGIGVYRGSNYIVELLNDMALGIIVKDKSMVGKPLFESMPELESQLKKTFDNVMQSGIPFHANEYEITLLRNEKNEKAYFNLVFEPIREDDNTISGIKVVANEVTEQVIARRKIEESEKQLQNIFSAAPAAIAVLEGAALKYVLANADYQKMTNRSEAQLLGKTMLEVFPELTGTGAFEIFENVFKSGEAFSVAEYPTALDKNNDGVLQQIYYKFTAEPIKDADGKFNSIMVLAIDITPQIEARKKIEESEFRYHEMIYSSPSMMAILKGEDMIIEIANDSILASWGKGKDIIGKSIFLVLPETVEQGFDKLLLSVYKTGEPVHAYESPATLLRNGIKELVYYNFIYQAQRNVHGEIEGVAIIATEVTPQAELNKKIKESEHRFQSMVYSSPSMIAIFKGEDMIIEIANDAVLESWGKGKDIIGKPVFEVMPETAEQGFDKLLLSVYKTGEPAYAYETPITLIKNGKPQLMHYTFVYQAQRDINGIIVGVAVLANEVTPQVETKNKLKASEEKFRLLVLQAPVAICVMRGENYVIEVINQGMFEMWDRTLEEALNNPVFEVLPELIGQGFKELLDNVYKTGERFVAEELPISLKRHGKLENAFVKFVYEPLREADGTISGVMALAHEITEQVVLRKKIEESEKKFKQLAELMPQKVWTADTKGNKNYFNKTLLDYAGLSFEVLKGEGWKKIIHPDDWEQDEKKWQESVSTGKKYQSESRFLRKDGEFLWHLTLAVPLKDEQDNIILWIGSKTEIHEQRKQKEMLEEAVSNRTAELKQANEGLLKMNKELEAFTYVSSHDLQEPLRKIQTFAGRILEKENQNLSDYGKNYFRLMQNAAQRMQTLIQDLLAFSRISSAERKFENTDLNIIIEEVKKEFKDDIAEKHATIEVKEICKVKIIPFQFRQLMYNLISNALKFSNPKIPPHITIENSNIKYSNANDANLALNKEYCHITISDNGIGFEKEYSEKIFQVFQKLHGKEEYAGTGIGLAIVKKIVENHNGIITATSELNKGTRFDIYIPAGKNNS